MTYMIRAMAPSDWQGVAAVYWQGIQTRLATFQTELPSWEAWDSGHVKTCRFVACDPSEPEKILGFAALSPVSSRCIYAGVAEVSVYVSEAARGQGLGKQLLERLVEASEAEGFWTLQSGIIADNTASIRLHEACGFKVVGRRERLAQMPGKGWLDVMLMERRSAKIGL